MGTSPYPRVRCLASAVTRYAFCVLGVLLALFVAFPLIVLVPSSLNQSRLLEWPRTGLTLEWYESVFGSVAWLRAFATSTAVASLAALVSTVIGAGAACRVYGWRPSLRFLAEALFLSPLAVPVVSLALGMYICLVKVGLADTMLGLIGAHCVLCIPLTFGLVAASLARRQPFLEEAALNLGASRMQVWLMVTLPSARNAVLASLLLSFAVSFTEVVVVIFLTDTRVTTLSKELWDGMRFEISPVVAAVSVVTMVVAVPIVVLFDILATKALAPRYKQ